MMRIPSNAAIVITLSHPLFQGCSILVGPEYASMSNAELDAELTLRFREKLQHGLLALGLRRLFEDSVRDTLRVSIHAPLQIGVVNYACDGCDIHA